MQSEMLSVRFDVTHKQCFVTIWLVPFQDFSCSLLANLFVAVQFGFEISDLTRPHIFGEITFHVEKIQPLKQEKYFVLNK